MLLASMAGSIGVMGVFGSGRRTGEPGQQARQHRWPWGADPAQQPHEVVWACTDRPPKVGPESALPPYALPAGAHIDAPSATGKPEVAIELPGYAAPGCSGANLSWRLGTGPPER